MIKQDTSIVNEQLDQKIFRICQHVWMCQHFFISELVNIHTSLK